MLPFLLWIACTGPKRAPSADSADSAEPAADPPLLDPGCPDGAYAETLPTAEEDLTDLLDGFEEAEPEALIQAMLERRYPDGAWILANAPDFGGGTCAATWLDLMGEAYTSTPEYLALTATLLVHECGHLLDSAGSTDDAALFQLRSDLGLYASGGGAPPSPARGLLLLDAYRDLRPPCAEGERAGCDGYADPYLHGDPEDDVFDMGDQGLDVTVEELQQYIHGLATALALSDLAPTSSYRDGLLTFLWYTQRLLAIWRAEDPEGWRRAMDEGGYATLLLNLWGQAWLYLEATDGLALGVYDDEIEPLVRDPALLAELQALRDLLGCGG